MRNSITTLLFVVTLATLWQCARQVMPSGGPKDTQPPKVLQENPPNGSTLFTGNKFSIRFSEFVELDKINKQLLISPPMVKMPSFHLRGKTLTVSFNELLKSNTTYSVYFGSSIVDITEKNPLNNYSYIFSTGKTIDSMSLAGTVINAFDLKPVEDAYVMLYKNNNDTLSLDSLPLLVKPYYLSKTDKAGKFHFNALANERYLIFGLKDQNNSLTFDQPQEEIAFLDSLVQPQFKKAVPVDTMAFDTIQGLSKDSLSVLLDSLKQVSDSISNAQLTAYQLRLFVNADTVQKLLQAELLRKNTLRFSFSLPAKNIKIKILNKPDSVWHYETEDKLPADDTLLWFLKEPHPDTLNLLFMQGADTLDKLYLRAIPKEKRVRRGNKKRKPLKEFLQYHANIQGVIKPNQQFQLIFDQPVSHFETDSVLLVKGGDSLYNPEYYFADSLHRKITFPFVVRAATAYRLVVPDSALSDWNGVLNKRMNIAFRSKELKEYGKLTLQVSPPRRQPFILQMLNGNEKVVDQRFFNNDTTFVFLYIKPDTYHFKLIFDNNNNRRWDTGNYLKKRQPEKVLFYSKQLDIKSNWEYEEKWEVQ